MSTAYIRPNVKLSLYGRSGGRCQFPGCPELLDMDNLSARTMNNSCIAHIVADSPGGPRGDRVLSEQLGKDISNLMLVCPKHHRLIDSDVETYTIEALRSFKKEHEDRVRRLMNISPRDKSELLLYRVRIGRRTPVINLDKALRAVIATNKYPVLQEFQVDLTRVAVRDDEPSFWERMAEETERQIDEFLRPRPGRDSPVDVAVFALAPIPLLMVLGRCLGNIGTVSTFQKIRVPDTWIWEDSTDVEASEVSRPVSPSRDRVVALLLSVSGKVQHDEVAAVIGTEDIDFWEVSLSRPGVDLLRTKVQLESFSQQYRKLLTEIRTFYGQEKQIHVFPAIPNSVAIECGKVLLPKADPRLSVYDAQEGGYRYALDLLPVGREE